MPMSTRNTLESPRRCTSLLDSEATRVLLGYVGINTRAADGQTPLHFSAGYNADTRLATELICKGADIKARNDWGETPLHVAARNDLPTAGDMVKLLLMCGADVNAKTTQGITASDYAYGSHPSRSILLKYSVLENYSLRSKYTNNYNWMSDAVLRDRCLKEIARMKTITIAQNVTLFDAVFGEDWELTQSPRIFALLCNHTFPI